ncbi:MAG: hypothetical protein KDD53_06050, partial [Bdellovibrionales bacterium]|nr:hypothetical protein [Bdellovibrionales bacterium]
MTQIERGSNRASIALWAALLPAAAVSGCATPEETQIEQEAPEVGNALDSAPKTIEESESLAIEAALENTKQSWQFLPDEINKKFKDSVGAISLEGFSRSSEGVEYLPGGMLLTIINFTANEGTVVEDEQGRLAFNEKIVPQLTVLKTLRELDFFNESDVAFNKNAQGTGYDLVILSKRGSNVENAPDPVLPEMGTKTIEERMAIWTKAFTALRLTTFLDFSLSSKQQLELRTQLEKLSDYHSTHDAPELAKIAQALSVHFNSTPEGILDFGQLGRLESISTAKLPTEFILALN